MAWSNADLIVIETALATGQRRVKLNGREVEYHSVGDMLKARDAIKNELSSISAAASGATRPRSYRARTSKGL